MMKVSEINGDISILSTVLKVTTRSKDRNG